MNKLLKMTAGIAVCALVIAPLAACGESSSGNSANGVITIRGCEPENPLFPTNTQEVCGGDILDNLFNTLVSFDDKNDNKVVMEDAEKIDQSSDGLIYKVTLKKDRLFSDGSQVKADNYVKAWNFGALSSNAQMQQSFFAPIKGYEEVSAEKPTATTLSGLETTGDYTFSITLSKPDSSFLTMLGSTPYDPLPDSLLTSIQSDGTLDKTAEKEFGEKPVGNGPYMVESWTHNEQVKLVPNPKYAGEKPLNAGLTYKVYTDSNAAYADVQTGTLDVDNDVPAAHLSDFTTDSSVQNYNKPGATVAQLDIPEIKHFGFDEEGTLRRKAISMAINRAEIIEKIFDNTKSEPTDFSAPGIDGHADNIDTDSVLQYNETKAKELWAQADAITKFDGTFKIAYNADSDHKAWIDAACNSIKNTLGIQAQGEPYATFQEFLKARQNNIQSAFRSGWQPDYPFVSNYLLPLFHSNAADGKGSNDVNFKNADFDKYCDEGAAAKTQEDAIKKYEEAQKVLLTNLPAIPLWSYNTVFVFSKKVKTDTIRMSYKGTIKLQYLETQS